MKSWIDTPLPEGWKLSKNCEYCTILSGFPFSSTGFNTDGIGTPIVRIRDITSGHTETFYKGDFPISSLIENGDLLVGMDGDFNHCIWKSGRAILNQRCCKILCKNEWYKKYISYVLPFQLKLINELKNSTTVKHLNNTDILTASLPIPTDINILKRTVCFLDRNCNAVDRLVANMREKLLKLSEYRQSLITQAVTKGLDPNVEMKDSGVPWVGMIPYHWKCGKIKYFASISAGGTPDRMVKDYWNNGTIPWIKTGELLNDDIVSVEECITPLALRKSAAKLFPEGTVLVAMYGQGKTRGMAGMLTWPATTNQACACICPKNSLLLGKFLLRLMESSYAFNREKAAGTGQPNLNQDIIANLLIPIPPLDEQMKIINHLDVSLKHIQHMKGTIDGAINKLQEYRSSLITAVVTGKIDINEVNR